MKNAYIKFRTEQDCRQGCAALVTEWPVSCLSNDVYCIPWGGLALLDGRDVQYSFASEADLAHAQPVWNFAASKA